MTAMDQVRGDVGSHWRRRLGYCGMAIIVLAYVACSDDDGDDQTSAQGSGAGGDAGAGQGGAGGSGGAGGGPSDALCSQEGWCWSYPLPHGNDLTAIWNAADGSLAIVGAAGTVQRREGDAWTVEIVGDGTMNFSGVWASSASDIYAVGDASIWHFDGGAWSESATVTNSLRGVWGSAPNDVYAVGNGNLTHYDGAQWTAVSAVGSLNIMNGVQLNAVWGSGADDVFVVGATGSPIGENPVPMILHRGAAGWEQMTLPAIDAYLLSVSGTGPSDVYAAGHDLNGTSFAPILLHYDGNAWTALDPPQANGLVHVWAAGSALLVAGREGFNPPRFQTWRRDGDLWGSVEPPPELDGPATFPNSTPALGGSDESNLYLVGPRGHLARYDGTSWARMQGEAGAQLTLRAAIGIGSDDGFAAGSSFWSGVRTGVILRRSSGAWTLEDVPDADSYTGFWALSDTDVFASGREVDIVRWNGSTWATMPPPASSYGDRNCMWASGPNDVWAAGQGPVWRFDGANWNEAGFNVQEALGMWGSAPNDIYFVLGENGTSTVYHYDGSALAPIVDPVFQTGDEAYGVWGASASDVYMVGGAGAVWHYDGANWTDDTPPEDIYDLYAVAGTSATDVYAFGFGGAILHRDATGWTRMTSITNRNLYGAWMRPDGRAYVAGDRGAILTRAISR